MTNVEELITNPKMIEGEIITKNVKSVIRPPPSKPQQPDYYIGEITNDDVPYWVRSAMSCLANCK